MSVPMRISSPLLTPEEAAEGVCYPAEEAVCVEPPPSELVCESSYAPPAPRFSREIILADGFARLDRPAPLAGKGGPSFGLASLFTSLAGCGGPDDSRPVPGDPISDVSPLGGEVSLTGSATSGKIRGIQISSAGPLSSVVWSISDALVESGTYAYLQSGTTQGTRYQVLPDTSSVHQSTSGVRLENGDSVAIYTRYRGVTDPSRLVAQRISSAGMPLGGEILIRPDIVRSESQVLRGQVVSLSGSFVVIYQDGGAFGAVRYDNTGVELGRVDDLGPAPNGFQAARGAGDEWSLAQVVPGRAQIRVRSFDGLQPSGADATVDATGLPSQPTLSLAMQENGSMILAWNLTSGSIDAALLSPAGSLQGETFRAVTTGGVANSVALASDHRGNFVLAYEQAGGVYARLYDGTDRALIFSALAGLSPDNSNSNVGVDISESGVLSLIWIKSPGSGLQEIVRRDFQITYR